MNELQDIKKSLARIETAVIGDSKTGIPGLAKRTKDLEDYQEKDKKFKNKVAGGMFVSIPILGFLFELGKEWYQKHF